MKLNKTDTFYFGDDLIRTVEKDGEWWFSTADVCNALNIQLRSNGKPNTTQVTRPLNDFEKDIHPLATRGGNQRLSIVSMGGLYKIIMRSNVKNAKEFLEWATRVARNAERRKLEAERSFLIRTFFDARPWLDLSSLVRHPHIMRAMLKDSNPAVYAALLETYPEVKWALT